MQLPASIRYLDATYEFARYLGKGGVGMAGLYGNSAQGFLVVKSSYCGRSDAQTLGSDEVRNAAAVAALGPCAAADLSTPIRLSGADLVRPALATAMRDGCHYSVYEYTPQNLAEWLATNQRRKPTDVSSIFLQVHSMLQCLRRSGFYYDDLKPSNLLVTDTSAGPRVRIGDLGGIDRQGDATITVTRARLPPSTMANLSWDKIDVVASFLLGELALQLLLRHPLPGERHPMNDFLACIQTQATDACIEALVAPLAAHLADGLDLANPLVRDLASAALALLGYRGTYTSIDSLAAARSALFPR